MSIGFLDPGSSIPDTSGLYRKIKEQQAEIERLRKDAERLLTLSTKWCDINHPDWLEIKKISAAMEETKEVTHNRLAECIEARNRSS